MVEVAEQPTTTTTARIGREVDGASRVDRARVGAAGSKVLGTRHRDHQRRLRAICVGVDVEADAELAVAFLEAAKVGEHVLYQTNEYVTWGAFGPPDEVPLFPDGATALEQGLYEVWDGAQAVAGLTEMLTAYPEIKDVHFWAQLPGEPIDQGSARIEYLAGEVLPKVQS